MKKGITLQGFLSVFSEPSAMSVMVSQVLFGETYGILEQRGPWTRISMDTDGVEGWITSSSVQLTEISRAATEKTVMALNTVTYVKEMLGNTRIPVPAGSVWPSEPGIPFHLGGMQLIMENPEEWIECGKETDPELVGMQLQSVPFLQGGRSGMGVDGPGLVQLVGKAMGLSLPRYSPEQSGMGQTLNFIDEIRKGDLVFFDNQEGEIIHSGIALDPGRILHVHNLVRTDRLDHQGIYNSQLKEYTHHLRLIKRPII
jgi:hypothetical protein